MAPKTKNPRLKSGHKSKTPNPESEIDFLEVTEELEQAGVSDAKPTLDPIQKITELQHELRLFNDAANVVEILFLKQSTRRICVQRSTRYLFLGSLSLYAWLIMQSG